jgi:hypothetical protein
MVLIGSGAKRRVVDMLLSPFACELIILSCDPRKKEIAFLRRDFIIKPADQE